MNYIFSIDPGNEQSGIVVLSKKRIIEANNIKNEEVFNRIINYKKCDSDEDSLIVLYEDIKPYSVQLGAQTLDTVKFIGQLEYRLKESEITHKPIYRWEIKKWVFDNFFEIAEDRIERRIITIGAKNKNGEMKKPSFVYVDDRIVVSAMKEYWDIPTPKPGKKSKYGLSKHSWQALAVATYFLKTSYS